jgi:hypothetical protein
MSEPLNNKIPGFNLNALRLPQNFTDEYEVRKKITFVPVRKPYKTEFFRIHPGEDFRFRTKVMERKESEEIYIISPELSSVLPELQFPITLHTAINSRRNVFLIPVRLPGSNGLRSSWSESLFRAVVEAETKWVRARSNMDQKCYEITVALGMRNEPEWPTLKLEELVEIGFKNRIVTTKDHPVILELLGY